MYHTANCTLGCWVIGFDECQLPDLGMFPGKGWKLNSQCFVGVVATDVTSTVNSVVERFLLRWTALYASGFLIAQKGPSRTECFVGQCVRQRCHNITGRPNSPVSNVQAKRARHRVYPVSVCTTGKREKTFTNCCPHVLSFSHGLWTS